jgi:hypothetical protein
MAYAGYYNLEIDNIAAYITEAYLCNKSKKIDNNTFQLDIYPPANISDMELVDAGFDFFVWHTNRNGTEIIKWKKKYDYSGKRFFRVYHN